MLKEAIEKILSLAVVEKIEVGGREYFTRELSPVKSPVVSPIKLHTLDGLIKFAESLQEGAPLVYVVDSPTQVSLCGGLDEKWKTRNVYAVANCYECNFQFGNFYDQEEFMIALMAKFDIGGHRDELLKIASSVRDESEAKFEDTGATQQVSQKRGAKFEFQPLPNPVLLAPFRTFREVEQPVSKFVFRYRSGNKFALFDAEGEAWKYAAIDGIAAYLGKQDNEIAVLK